MFRKEFSLAAKEEKSLADKCIFIVAVYIKAWFTATSAIRARDYDLKFLKKLIDYESIILKVSITKFVVSIIRSCSHIMF